MDINQNQQTNTFVKGMNTDTTDFLLPEDSYRYAENIRIVTNSDSNSGEVRITDGNKEIVLTGNDTINGTILAMNSIRDIIVLIVNESQNNNVLWSIYTCENNIVTNENNIVTKVLTCVDEVIWNSGKNISTVLRWESGNNIKLYIADTIHPLMCVQINNTYSSNNFKELFAYNNINLPSPEVNVISGGNIPAGIVQYAYRIYKENGSATTISKISKPLSLYKNSYQGFGPEKNTNKAVEINIGSISGSVLDRIQVYRINYMQSGQLPVITMIADQKITNKIIDYGNVEIEKIAVNEFESLYNMKLTPNVIESKGDYLFLAGVKYAEDSADDTFKNIDTRCFSKGNYCIQNETSIDVIDTSDNNVIANVDDEDLKHHAFDGGINKPSWNVNHWGTIQVGNDYYNGIGKYFAWKYILKELHEINPSNNTGSRSYKRGEVYRFGVRLFDHEGNVSSVKWMCDILMPPIFDSTYGGLSMSSGAIYVKELGILFTPINTSDEEWQKVASYEIVLCERKVSDSYVLMQGITGKVLTTHTISNDFNDSNTQTQFLSPSGFFTMNPIIAESNFLDTDEEANGTAIFASDSWNVLMFASPEYVYASDTMKDVVDNYKDNLKLEYVTQYRVCSTPINSNSATKKYHNDYPSTQHSTTTPVVKTQLLDDSVSSWVFGINNDFRNVYYYDLITLLYNRSSTHSDGYTTYMDLDFNYFYSGTVTNVNDFSLRTDSNYTLDGTGAYTQHFFNYFYPASFVVSANSLDYLTITDTEFVDSPDYSDFGSLTSITFYKNLTAIGNKQFVNWTNPFLYYGWRLERPDYFNNIIGALQNTSGDFPSVNDDDNDIIPKQQILYPTGSGGKCILFLLEGTPLKNTLYDSDPVNYAPNICVQNLIKLATPYGGYSNSAIQSSTYLSVGGNAASNESVDLFAGDSYIKMFTYNAAHEWWDAGLKKAIKMATVYAVPIETNIDILAQFSDALYNTHSNTTGNSIYVQDKASSFDTYSLQDDAYMYNAAYSSSPNVRTWYPNLTTEGVINDFDTRVHYSERKINNETVDNWTQFKSSNFLDVDSRYGKITALKLFKDKLIFWQQSAIGALSVNERIIINDLSDSQLLLGTGGVLERYDYASTLYGMKPNQHAYAASDSALYFWDSDLKEILQFGLLLTPLSTIKFVKNYINKATSESELPTLVYDDKFKEVMCNIVDNKSIVYNEQIQGFTSVYDCNIQFAANIFGKLYESKKRIENKIYVHNSNNGSALFFGESIYPTLLYIINKDPLYNKTFDVLTFGGRLYGGNNLSNINFTYKTPLKQESRVNGGETNYTGITNREYDFRLNIPRAGKLDGTTWVVEEYGDRMRGKTMWCEIKSSSNDLDFSLQYITTKFRMSWS